MQHEKIHIRPGRVQFLQSTHKFDWGLQIHGPHNWVKLGMVYWYRNFALCFFFIFFARQEFWSNLNSPCSTLDIFESYEEGKKNIFPLICFFDFFLIFFDFNWISIGFFWISIGFQLDFNWIFSKIEKNQKPNPKSKYPIEIQLKSKKIQKKSKKQSKKIKKKSQKNQKQIEKTSKKNRKKIEKNPKCFMFFFEWFFEFNS